MRKLYIIFFALLYICKISAQNTDNISTSKELYTILNLSFKNLNISSSLPEDSIIKICLKLEAKYRGPNSRDTLFWIRQITTNSLCLNGDLGLAATKANQMYEEAQAQNSQLGTALSLQAIGDTYMHSDQYKQASEMFNQAEQMFEGVTAPYAKIRLSIQQMHVNMKLNDLPQLQKHIFKSIELSEFINKSFRDDIDFYIACYQAFYYIGQSEQGLASEYLKKALSIPFPHHLYDLWRHFATARYYELIKNYPQALLYCDSILQCVNNKNVNTYINFSMQQANLYEKMDELGKAGQIYAQMNLLSDSLNTSKYTTQVDSLRVIYWIDQIKVQNATAYNQMLTRIIIYSSISLLLIIIIISIAKKRNAKFIESKKRLQEVRHEADESIRSKSLFLSNMSHELRTPLNAIVGFSNLLADAGTEDPALKQQCGEVIEQNSDLLLKLINDIVDFSDLKGKNIAFTWEKYNAVTLCQHVFNTIGKVRQTSAKMAFTTDFSELTLYTDRGRLQQVLINLLVNATKFTTEGNITLNLSLSDDREFAIFTVEDTGCGIPLEKQAHIFQRFEKLHEGIQGAGLGLSICQLIVEQIGGKIWIDPTYIIGARFVFTHPIERTITEENLNE